MSNEQEDPSRPFLPAVFLDRDGTLIREVHYIARPEQVALIDGCVEALALLRAAGFPCIVVSNQSGVGRGKLSEDDMHSVQREVDRQLARAGVALDAAYFCTIAPSPETDQAPDRRTRVDHPDRKPGPGMLLRAAREHGLDVSRSWMVGDMLSDVLAGKNAGVRGTIHVRTGHGTSQPEASKLATIVADNVLAAAHFILRETRVG